MACIGRLLVALVVAAALVIADQRSLHLPVRLPECFLLAARLDVGYNHGVESMVAAFAVDGWHGRLREDVFAHSRDHEHVPTMAALGLDQRRLERLHVAVKHLDASTHTVLSPRVSRGAIRMPATCMGLPLHGVDEALLRSAARLAPGLDGTSLTVNEAEVSVAPERLLGVVAGPAAYGVKSSATHSGDGRAVPQPLPKEALPRGLAIPGAVVVNVSLHASGAALAGIPSHLIVKPIGHPDAATGSWSDDSVQGAELWGRWRRAMEARAAEGRPGAAGAARAWRAIVGAAGPCLRFLPPLVTAAPKNESGPATGRGGGAGQRRRHQAWGRGLPPGLELGGDEAWSAAEGADVPRPHAVVELGPRCLPVALLGLRFEAVVVDFESLDCEAAWTGPASRSCAEGMQTAPRACESALLRPMLDEAAWEPHSEIDVACEAVG